MATKSNYGNVIKHTIALSIFLLSLTAISSEAFALTGWQKFKMEFCFVCDNTAEAIEQSQEIIATHTKNESKLVSFSANESKRTVVSNKMRSQNNSLASQLKAGFANLLYSSEIEMHLATTVKLGIDLSKITKDSFKGVDGNLVIELPPIEVIAVEVDMENSTINSKAGITLSHEDKVRLIQSALESHKERIRRDALSNDDFVNKARKSAKDTLKQLLAPFIGLVQINFIS